MSLWLVTSTCLRVVADERCFQFVSETKVPYHYTDTEME